MQRSNLDMLSKSAIESNKTFEKTYKEQSYRMNATLLDQQKSVAELDKDIRLASEARFMQLNSFREEFDKQLIDVFYQYQEGLEKAAALYEQRFRELKKRAEAVQEYLKAEQECREKSIEEFYKSTQSQIDALCQRLSDVMKIEHENSQGIYDSFKQVINKQTQLLAANKQESVDRERELYESIDEMMKSRMDELIELKRSIFNAQKRVGEKVAAEKVVRQKHEASFTSNVYRILERLNGSLEEVSRVPQ